MQILLRSLFMMLTLFSVILYSCRDVEVAQSESNQLLGSVFIQFQRVDVRLADGLSTADFNTFIYDRNSEQMPGANLRTTDNRYDYLEGVNEEMFFGYLATAMKRYPDMAKEKFDEADMRQITRDIPSITTPEMAREQKVLIWDYYNVLIKNDLKRLILANQGKSGGRTTDIPVAWELHAYDIYVLNSDPLAANCWGLGRIGAVEAWKEKYPNPKGPDSYEDNEYKHAVLNAFSIGEMNLRCPDKQYGIRTTRKFANAHEYVPETGNLNLVNQNWNLGNANENGMDLHNNLVGRTYMEDHVDVFLGHVSWVPSRDKIKNDIYNMGRIWITDGNVIRLRNPDRTWFILGDKDGGRNYDTYPAVRETLCHLKQ